MQAEKTESRERSLFHVMANDVNTTAVDWYETATTWFGASVKPIASIQRIIR